MSRTPTFNALRRLLRLAWTAEKADEPTAEHVERWRDSWLASRREFLETSVKLATVASVPWLATRATGATEVKKGSAEVVIIGAGIAGLNCAYQLEKRGVQPRILDAANRVGGRIWSLRGKYPNAQVAELGGEFIDTPHPTMRALAQEFGIALDDLVADTEGLRTDTYFFGGEQATEMEVIEGFRPIAARMAEVMAATGANEDEPTPEQEALFARTDQMSITQWLDSIGATGVIRQILLDAYTIEYGLDAEEQSVFNLLYLIDHENADPFRVFGESDERYHAHAGNDVFTSELGRRLTRSVEFEHRLVAVRLKSDGRYQLAFDRDGSAVEVVADHVVLALPFTLLREVELAADLGFSEDKLQIIRELGYGTNVKLMSGYAQRVWRHDPHRATGAALSDNGMQSLWETSRGQGGESGILTNFLGGRIGAGSGQGTSEELMRRQLPLIDQVFPGVEAAYLPGSAIRAHWPSYALTKGSYACYKPGQWAFAGTEIERVANLHFCGEHCSLDWQGYMEGAAETGEKAAMEILHDLG